MPGYTGISKTPVYSTVLMHIICRNVKYICNRYNNTIRKQFSFITSPSFKPIREL